MIDRDKISSEIEKKSKEENPEKKPLSILEDVEDFIETYTKHILGEERVSIGYDNLNKYITGWRKKSVYTIIGGTGMGKSLYLANLAVQAAKSGSNVIIFTLEMEAYSYAARIYSILTNIETLDLVVPGIDKRIREGMKMRVPKNTGHLYVVDYNPKEVSVYDLAKDVEKMDVDLVIVDYAELLSATTDRKDAYYLEINDIFYGLKTIAKALGLPIITAAQMNRSGYSKYGGTEEFVGLRNVQGSLGITQVSDVVFSINYSIEDKECGRINLDIVKNRYGVSDVRLSFSVDYSKSTITDFGFTSVDVIDNNLSTNKEPPKPVKTKKANAPLNKKQLEKILRRKINE